MARKNGFEDMADYFGTLSKVNMKKVSQQSLEEAAEFYMKQLIPKIPESLKTGKHMKDQVIVTIEDDGVKVAFEDTAYYWRFVENGTTDQKAQLFASKTYQINREKIEALMVKKILEKWEGE